MRLLTCLPPKISDVLKTIGRLAEAQGIPAYFVGGGIRDIILKRPNLDVDIVLEADAIKFARGILQRSGFIIKNVYPQFGTVTLEDVGGVKVDLATARKETYAHPGALPNVSAGTIHDDLFRRDFSINAMAVLVNPSGWGNLVDDFNGLVDLKAKKVRILHEQSFIDDPTRILRAVRFEQRFHFHLEKKTLVFLKEALQRNAVAHVKAPRYFEEFKKVLGELPNPSKCLQRLGRLGALGFLSDRYRMPNGAIRHISQIGKTMSRYLQSVSRDKIVERWLIFFLPLVYKLSLPQLERLISRFQCSGEEREKIFSFWQFWHTIDQPSWAKISPRDIYKRCKPVSLEGFLVLRVLTSSTAVRSAIDRFLKEFAGVHPEVNGEDLKLAGVKPAKKMGEILQEILYQKIEGRVHSYADEIKLAQTLNSN